MKVKIQVVLLSFFVTSAIVGKAQQQSLTLQAAKQVLTSLYSAYDSMQYVSFDIKMNLDIDSLNSENAHTEYTGKFSVAGKKYRYTLMGNDVIQNDSFLVSCYKPGKIIVIDKPNGETVKNAVLGLPGLVDSIFSMMSFGYTFYSDTTNTSRPVLVLKAKYRELPYREIKIQYDAIEKYIYKADYMYNAFVPAGTYVDENTDSTITIAAGKRKHYLTIEYSKYRFSTEGFQTLFSEANLLRYDGRRFWPADGFTDFQIMDVRK